MMRRLPFAHLAPDDLAVIAYRENNGELVVLHFPCDQEREVRFAFRCIAEYDPACIMLHRKPHAVRMHP